jgi:hypothetical protein
MNRWGILLSLVVLHNGAGQEIYVNPREATTLRGPGEHEHFSKSVHCQVGFSDGKFATVMETCKAVRSLFENRGKP